MSTNKDDLVKITQRKKISPDPLSNTQPSPPPEPQVDEPALEEPGIGEKLQDNISDQFQKNLGGAGGGASGAGNEDEKKPNSMMELTDNLLNLIANFNNKVNEFLGVNALKDKVSNYAGDVASAVTGGIGSAASAVGSAVKEGVGQAYDTIANKLSGDAPAEPGNGAGPGNVPQQPNNTASTSPASPTPQNSGSTQSNVLETTNTTPAPQPAQVSQAPSPATLEPMPNPVTSPSSSLANTPTDIGQPPKPKPGTSSPAPGQELDPSKLTM